MARSTVLETTVIPLWPCYAPRSIQRQKGILHMLGRRPLLL